MRCKSGCLSAGSFTALAPQLRTMMTRQTAHLPRSETAPFMVSHFLSVGNAEFDGLHRRLPGAGTPVRCTGTSRDNLLLARDVIPHHVAIQLPTRSEEYSPLRRFHHLVGEAHVLLALVPARQQEHVERDSLAGAEHR